MSLEITTGGGGITQAAGDLRYLKLAGGTMTGAIVTVAGTSGAPAIQVGNSTHGFYADTGTGILYLKANNGLIKVNGSTFQLGSTHSLNWTSGVVDATNPDLVLLRDAANTLALKNSNADQLFRSYAMNGGYWERASASELLTLSTIGLTTDTTANLLPANSIIEAVVARVTTTIATSTSWQLGDATTAGRFTAANATMTAGTTDVGLVHVDVAGAGGPRQTAAAKVRVTAVGIASGGVVRITAFYRRFVPPTS